MKKRILSLALAVLLLSSGFLSALQVFSSFRSNIIAQHEEKLADITASVDRSIQGYIQIHRDILRYVTERRGFLEAEQHWEQTGSTEELLFRMEENLLNQDLHIKTLLAIQDSEVLLSTDGNTGYQLPKEPTELLLCQDENGQFYFGILLEHDILSYAAVIELDVLCEYLAQSSAVNEKDRMLLTDAHGQIFICHHEGISDVQPVTEASLALAPARKIALEAVGTDTRKVSFYEVEQEETSTTGYALLGNKAASNGFFTICILDAYDAYLNALKQDTMVLLISFCAILLGMVLVMSHIGSLSAENRKAAREMKQLQQKQEALEKINDQTRQLAHHQRLETIGTLTSSISHEFNNLLTPIMSYSLMTLEKLPSEEEELADNLIEIFNASEKAKEIISRLSDLSRKSSPSSIRSVSVDALVQKTLSVAMPAKPDGVEVQLNLNCSDQRIRANEIQITQLILNLILNAFHAMGQQGKLVIDSTYDDRYINLHVTDNGCGIPKEILDKIFDPFFTTKDSGKGTGLGLAIAAQVVEDHKGTIRVESTLGQGTRFEVQLPRETATE